MNPDNYGSLPACKKLAEVLAAKGIVVETEAHWIKYGKDTILKYRGDGADAEYGIPTYSMPEVWRELPEAMVNDGLEYYKTSMSGATCGYFHSGKRQWLCVFSSTNPTDALIDLLIWVVNREGGKGK